MWTTLLKALELLLKALERGTSAERKRKALAKELLRIYIDIGELVARGRNILVLLSGEVRGSPRAISLALLTEQIGELDSPRERLSSGSVGQILRLHLPSARETVLCAMTIKADQLWCALDQLVTDGRPVSPARWIKRLEIRMRPHDYSLVRGVIRLSDAEKLPIVRLEKILGQKRARARSSFDSPGGWACREPVVVVTNRQEIEKAGKLLDDITDSNEQLRTLILEKFKLEDVL